MLVEAGSSRGRSNCLMGAGSRDASIPRAPCLHCKVPGVPQASSHPRPRKSGGPPSGAALPPRGELCCPSRSASYKCLSGASAANRPRREQGRPAIGRSSLVGTKFPLRQPILCAIRPERPEAARIFAARPAKPRTETAMPAYRSRTTTHGRNMAGARGLWRATGMKDADFGKPIIAVVNSFTQFVPGHVHLKDLGQLVAREIEQAGGVAKECSTIAVDDGIAMGHDGMLYSLPSRELIADSVEYMANAHCADGLVCISNCDKITPGMLMAALRLNIPAVFVSDGPMEAGKVTLQ